ncbi:MAG: tautomerase family protein [Candidatus Obscuribacterales bacterium]|nr:tautomerase family protein [Candidatus Obscuribacterales bacterium]
MPHIVVKLWPGSSEEQKQKLADEIVKAGSAILGKGDAYFSVDIEEVESTDWAEQVYKPEIEGRWDNLYRKPGYKM